MYAYIAYPYRCTKRAKFGRILKPHQTVRLSHIGARPIPLPNDVICTWHKTTTSTTQNLLRFAGPRGVREVALPEGILPTIKPSSPKSAPPQKTRQLSEETTDANTSSMLVMQCENADNASQRSHWGLTAALVANCVQGVSLGFTIDLHLVGVGYRAAIETQDSTSPSASPQQTLVLRLGYPRSIRVAIPSTMQCEVALPTEIRITGNDKAALAQLAARIRTFRPPEPYNGKGVFVGAEKVQRKEVKKK